MKNLNTMTDFEIKAHIDDLEIAYFNIQMTDLWSDEDRRANAEIVHALQLARYELEDRAAAAAAGMNRAAYDEYNKARALAAKKAARIEELKREIEDRKAAIARLEADLAALNA